MRCNPLLLPSIFCLLLAISLALAAGCGPSQDPPPNGEQEQEEEEETNGEETEEPEGCLMPNQDDPPTEAMLEDALGRATATTEEALSCLRSYTLSTTQPLRDGEPSNPRLVEEQEGDPILRTGSLMLDALYALTLEEVRQCSVEEISDGAFDEGRPMGCGEGGCFETGRLWNYVWTRDTAYAVDLGLAAMDPTRSRNSLDFKLSERRGGGDLQIVQDTGSGGSYPVSTDRVSWALGAWAVYLQLQGEEREAFGSRAYEALRNTLEHDRLVAFDPNDGLYRGEQSFLDWREQSYPGWTADDVVHVAMSKALSTNILHLRAMEMAAYLAEAAGEMQEARRYSSWADGLRQAIRDRLWLDEDGMFSTFVTTGLDGTPARRFDLLGSALAVILGVADSEQAASILSRYPHYGPGAPVIWPQQQLTAIYHNRGEWPFVTAYWLAAARVADNDAVADKMVRALVRGAALNLSNMENFEAATGAPWLDDGDYSGPVVNSQRQLWSVAAFLSMVHQTIFGLHARPEGLRVHPYVTRGMRNDLFADSDRIVLNGYPYAGSKVTIVVNLPEAGGDGGSYGVGEVRLDGQVVEGGLLAPEALGEESLVEVDLLDTGDRPPSQIELRDASDWRAVFGPRTPRIESVEVVGGRVRLGIFVDPEEREGVRLSIIRDGRRVAEDLPGTTAEWDDPEIDTAIASATPCYAIETCFSGSGNCSQRSQPLCWWADGAVQELGAELMENTGGSPSEQYGRFHYEGWGDPGDQLVLPSFTASRSGRHLLQLVFGNGAGPIATGVTCAVKEIVVTDVESGEEVGRGPAIMPHLGTWDRWAESSFVPVELQEGRAYRLTIGDGESAVNMSAFEHFASYTGGLGGRDGPFNRVNIAAVKVLAMGE